MSMSLDEEIDRAHRDRRHEPALLRRLLGVTLYVHSPIGPRSERLSICMFDRPDGIRVIPVFTDLRKAKAAGRGKVSIIPVQGRVLLEVTRGATLMINPNDVSCTLYPEEISALLESGVIAHVEAFTVGEDEELRICAPTVPSDVLAALLTETLSGMHLAERAYLAEAHWRGRDPALGWFVAVVAPKHYAERISRAIATTLISAEPPGRTLDVYFLEPEADLPEWIAIHGLQPIYDRQNQPHRRGPNGGRA